LDYKQVTVNNTWVRNRNTCSLFLDDSHHICWDTYHSGRSKSQSLGGKMKQPANAAVAWLPLWRLHQFGKLCFKDASFFWETSGSLMVTIQD